ncbi:hypothetical protein SAMN04488028_101849 [Reichenbachiella agariperforans]|uniref:Outer membrane protein beta-barrel domain-containing protein n=1 Tax=Reichenbachiella agariperforans TaxID=156994 RepID=A0A1M6L729_REIAG|nr:hypothetical protein SAMN04488028_101849 [Reichenbachiella agariperforans]
MILNHRYTYIFSLILFLGVVTHRGAAQSTGASDSTRMPVLSSASILVDYGKLATGLFMESETKYEGGVQLEFWNKLVLIGEYGMARLEPRGAYVNANYVSEGSYYRVGLGYKIDMNPKNNFVFSVRYGNSTYSDSGEAVIESASGLYDPFVLPFERQEVSAFWTEIVMSSERRIWKGLYTGFHVRLRVMVDYDDQAPLDVFSIPGYGRTFDKSVPAFNLYIKYSLERF